MNTGSQSQLQVSRVSIDLGESLNRSGWHERINMVSNALGGGGSVGGDSVAMACAWTIWKRGTGSDVSEMFRQIKGPKFLWTVSYWKD